MEAPELRQLICIGCPLGCHLVVEHHGATAWRVQGYGCKKGKTYGLEEATDPRRMLSTTVAIRGASWARLPVRSARPVPKDLVAPICRVLHEIEVDAPVGMGDVILTDVLGTGIDVVASRSL